MRRKGKESKLNVALTALLVVFVCLLSFSIGVISGKGWSDREYKIRHIENDGHLKSAQEDVEPLGDEMTDKEVELLTQRALEQERAKDPALEMPNDPMEKSMFRKVASTESEKPAEQPTDSPSEKPEMEDEGDKAPGREASMAKTDSQMMHKMMQKTKAKRKVSSLIPKPSVPKPETIEYTVQVAAYKTLDEAERHSQKLIDKGFPAFPVKAMIKGDLWYRVSIGSFKNRKQAMKYEKALKKQAVVTNTFVQKITRLKK